MKYWLLNQAFYPDVAATGQYLTELALGLAGRGHDVTVVSGRRAYDDPRRVFAAEELWRGIRISRVGTAGLGKAAKWRRAADFGSFLGLCAARMCRLRRPDVVVALTSPPLISLLGAWAAWRHRARFFYWVMDLNPDEAVAAGWLRAGSATAAGLEGLSRLSLRRATRVLALDRYMRARIVGKGIAPARVRVLPLWSQNGAGKLDLAGRTAFRARHGLEGKFVVMYSGNHSPCHPLATLKRAAERLRAEAGVEFVFAGGGSEFGAVREWARGAGLRRVRCLPYEPFDGLEGMLSAADLHVVVMGERLVGMVHPCKIYNILGVGAPALYIGPRPSHITDLLEAAGADYRWRRVAHGEVDGVVEAIRQFRGSPVPPVERRSPPIHAEFARDRVLPRWIGELEGGLEE